jgi:hypothetical protein
LESFGWRSFKEERILEILNWLWYIECDIECTTFIYNMDYEYQL